MLGTTLVFGKYATVVVKGTLDYYGVFAAVLVNSAKIMTDQILSCTKCS